MTAGISAIPCPNAVYRVVPVRRDTSPATVIPPTTERRITMNTTVTHEDLVRGEEFPDWLK